MKRPWLLLLLLPLLLPVVACAYTRREYQLARVSDTAPQLTLVDLVVGSGGTKIRFRYQVTGAQTRRIGIYPPGARGAFVITDANETQSYQLTAVDGISILPERTIVNRGETLEFTLTFERIPDFLGRINVGEGKVRPDAGETSWHFLDVPLD